MIRTKTVIVRISELIAAIANCVLRGNTEWRDTHTETLDQLCLAFLPHGSGLDGAHMRVDLDQSQPERVFIGPLDYHHMDESGGYNGWSEHSAFVSPSLAHGFHLRITGRDRNGVKEYLQDTMHSALSEVCQQTCWNCNRWRDRANPYTQFAPVCEHCGVQDEPTPPPTPQDDRFNRVCSLLRSCIAERLSILATDDDDERDYILTSDIDDQMAHWRAIESELLQIEGRKNEPTPPTPPATRTAIATDQNPNVVCPSGYGPPPQSTDPADSARVESSHGSIVFHIKTGEILRRYIYAGSEDAWTDCVRFDVVRFEREHQRVIVAGDQFDCLCFGDWSTDGTYTEPAHDVCLNASDDTDHDSER